MWDEGRKSQQLNQLGYHRPLATPKSVGGEVGEVGKLYYLLRQEVINWSDISA